MEVGPDTVFNLLAVLFAGKLQRCSRLAQHADGLGALQETKTGIDLGIESRVGLAGVVTEAVTRYHSPGLIDGHQLPKRSRNSLQRIN